MGPPPLLGSSWPAAASDHKVPEAVVAVSEVTWRPPIVAGAAPAGRSDAPTKKPSAEDSEVLDRVEPPSRRKIAADFSDWRH